MATQSETGQPNPNTGTFDQEMAGQSDLSPNPAAELKPSPLAQTAYDIQVLHDVLVNLSSVELRQVPILPDGAPLKPDETYINLNDIKRREFTGTDGMTVKAGTYIVQKDGLSYDLWNRLTNVG
ncbi:MAG: hypothetical protein AAFU71_19895 [Cyanobacteria bacterium J06632_22]